jgi:hypothetical protein
MISESAFSQFYSRYQMTRDEKKQLKKVIKVMRNRNSDISRSNAVSFDDYILEPFVENLPGYDDEILHTGFLLGINYYDFAIQSDMKQDYSYAEVGELLPGFTVGVIGSLKLHYFVDLKAEINVDITGRNIQYMFRNDDTGKDDISGVPSTMMRIPLYIKYKTKRFYNYRGFVTFGLSYIHDWSNHKIVKNLKGNKIDIKSDDWSIDLGFGFDDYLKFSKTSIVFKYSIGLKNLVKPESSDYAVNLTSIKNQYFTICIYFE